MKKYLNYLLLIPLPLMLVVLSQWEMNARGPYYERQHYDPEYQYLLNGLNILEGYPPGHVDHPGTTVQILTAAMVGLRQVFQDGWVAGEARRQDVLLHAEDHLQAIRTVFVISIALLYLLLAAQLYGRTGLLWAAIGVELFAFLSRNGVHALVRVSPEPALIALVLLATLLLATTPDPEPSRHPAWKPMLLGAVLGAGLVTKLTFLPLLLLILWFPRPRERLIAAAACVLSVAVLTIPIWVHAHRIANWIASLIGKQGRYGAGPSGLLPPFSTLTVHMQALLREEPFYFVMMAVLLVAWLVRWRSPGPQAKLDRMRIVVLLGVLVVQLTMVVKFGTAHYLVPGLAFMAAIYVLMVTRLRRGIPAGNRWGSAIPVLVLIFLSLAAARYTAAFARSVANSVRLHQETMLLDARIQRDFPECTIVPFYGATSVEYALALANDFASGRYTETLREMYPEAVQYNIWIPAFERFGDTIAYGRMRARLTQGECILVRGGRFLPNQDDPHFDRRLDLEEADAQEKEVLYRLNAIRRP